MCFRLCLCLRGRVSHNGDQLVSGFVVGAQVPKPQGMAVGQIIHGLDQCFGTDGRNDVVVIGIVFVIVSASPCRPRVQHRVKDHAINNRDTGDDSFVIYIAINIEIVTAFEFTIKIFINIAITSISDVPRGLLQASKLDYR